MRLTRKLGSCLIAATLTLGGAQAIPASASPPTLLASAMALPTSPTSAVAGQVKGHAARTVTLITGDRVTVAAGGSNQVSVKAGPGRAKISFLKRTVNGHLSVIPADALSLLHAGQLDPRLFDVTTLLNDGYDDSQRAALPLIVTGVAGATGDNELTARSASVASLPGATVVRDLPAVNGVAVKQSRKDAGAFWAGVTTKPSAKAQVRALSSGVGMIWLDSVRQPALDVSVPLIGAPAAWNAGFTGQSVPVAVVDTGIDATHPDLAGKVLAEQNFTDDGDALDHVGHGTHVASTITGSGAASNGKYKGVAPGAKLYDAKVCLEFGCEESWILAGMQWAAADQHAKVVNMSLGGGDAPGIDPLEQAVQTLTAQYGTLFVIAAGNSGDDATVGSPGSADDALTVGAVDKQDNLAPFSSRGPRIGDGALKPDITAPGVDITAARGKDGFLGTPGELYMALSGTSMATPHVTGSAAILAGEHPDWKPAQLKAALMASARPNPAIGVFAQGAGRVDVGRAIHQSVTTTPASVSFGVQQWPHGDDAPLTKTVTYHNDGKAAVTLALALHMDAQDDTPVPAGEFTLSASTVTVPAGGDASVTITVDTRIAGPDGYAGGELTATAGDVVVQTPFAVDKEVETYDVVINERDRTGQLTDNYDTILINLDNGKAIWQYDPSGTLKLRVPKGRYVAASYVVGKDSDHPEINLLAQPVLDVSGPRTVEMDARLAKPSSVTVPRSDATVLIAEVGFSMLSEASGLSAGAFGDSFDNLYSAQIGGGGTVNGLYSYVIGQFGQVQEADGQAVNSPYAYLLTYFDKGHVISGLHRAVKDQDLATVRVDLAAASTGVQGERLAFASLPTGESGNAAAGFIYDLPSSHTEYYNTDGGVLWGSELDEEAPSTDPTQPFPRPVDFTNSANTQYRAGKAYHETWNQGVFGPVFPARTNPYDFSTRLGDDMYLFAPVYGDGAGRAGYSDTTTAHLTVTKDGTVIAQSDATGDVYPVPAAAGRYKVEVAATRHAPWALSTETKVAWTFKSGHVNGTDPQPLPMSAIRFTPRLDLQNTAPKERMLTIPLDVQRQDGSTAGRLRSLKADVSFDDGRTWQSLPMDRKANGGVVKVKYPSGKGFVSVRASAVDTANNTVDETIIRAFRYDG